jgi:hypothetical protein
MLVLSCAVDHRAHEGIGGRVAISLAHRAYQAGALTGRGPFDLGGQRDVASDAITFRDDQRTRAVPAHCHQRGLQCRTIGDGCDVLMANQIRATLAKEAENSSSGADSR